MMNPGYGASPSSMELSGKEAALLPLLPVPSAASFFTRRVRNGLSQSCVERSKASIAMNGCRLFIFIRRAKLRITAAKPRRVEHEFNDEDQCDRESDAEDSDSMVLLVQLVRSFLRKMSLRATKAARSMLPPVFSSDLITFFVNGALLLTLLWVAKAFLEVVCSVGSMMFLGILMVRSIWSLLTYLQSQKDTMGSSRNGTRDFDDRQYRISPS